MENYRVVKNKIKTPAGINYWDAMDYLVKNHGFQSGKIIGSIGCGNETHRLYGTYKIDGDNFIVAGIMSGCGSQKWQSSLSVNRDQTAEITCKKCQPKK